MSSMRCSLRRHQLIDGINRLSPHVGGDVDRTRQGLRPEVLSVYLIALEGRQLTNCALGDVASVGCDFIAR